MSKSIFTSKLAWLGVVTFLLGGLEAVKDVVPPDVLPIIVSAIGVLTILLRLVTNTGVNLTLPLRRGNETE